MFIYTYKESFYLKNKNFKVLNNCNVCLYLCVTVYIDLEQTVEALTQSLTVTTNDLKNMEKKLSARQLELETNEEELQTTKEKVKYYLMYILLLYYDDYF